MIELGPWTTERLLGAGAMAEAWLCHGPQGRAAVKWFYDGSPAARARFERETAAMSRLSHPAIVSLLDRGETAGRPWLAMPLVDGGDLRQHALRARTRPPGERARRARVIAATLASALEQVHRSGLVHRDVKPSNVLLGEDGRAWLTDFGAVASAGEIPVGPVGTPGFAAPEQLAGNAADGLADQFGLGSTLAFVLTGAPFAGRPPSELDPTVPADLDATVMRLCAADPAARFPGMDAVCRMVDRDAPEPAMLAGRQAAIDAVAEALDRVAEGATVVVRVVGVRGSGRQWLARIAIGAAERRGLAAAATDDPAMVATLRLRGAILVMTAADGPADRVIELGPLGVADVRRSLFSVAPRTPALATVAERIHRCSGGNAAIVLDLLRRYRVEERVELPDRPAIDGTRFLRELDLDEAEVVGALAVLPGAADLALLDAVAQVPAEPLLPALVERGLVVAAGTRWAIAADALRDAVLAHVPDPDVLHERAAHALADRQPTEETDPLLARASALDPRAAEDVLLAGLRGSDSRSLSGRWLAIGSLRWDAGRVVEAREAYREALAAARDARARNRAAAGVGISALAAGDLPAAMAAFDESAAAATAAHEPDREVVARVNLCEASALAGRFPEARAHGEEALAIARGSGDRDLECIALRHLGLALLDAGDAAAASELLAEASALARAAGDEAERVAAHALRARAVLDARPSDRAAAASALERLAGIAGASGPDPEGLRLLGRAIAARANAVLGDGMGYRRALAEVDLAAAGARVVARLRAEIELGRAAIAAGEVTEGQARLYRASKEAAERGFLGIR